MYKSSMIFILLGLLVSGCTTIHFDNGPAPNKPPQVSKWHHNFAFALYEGSSPVNLKEECKDKDWQSIKTEMSFLNVPSSGLVNVTAGAVMLGSSESMVFTLPIWIPKSVGITCSE